MRLSSHKFLKRSSIFGLYHFLLGDVSFNEPCISDRQESHFIVRDEEYPKIAETSCYGRCNHDDKVTCQCDAYCKHFGDCCMDYDETCYHDPVVDNSGSYACTDVYGLKDVHHAWLVTRCSPSWNESYIESQCTAKSNAMHVYDRSGVNYHNIFCAICNFLHPRQVYMWGLPADQLCNNTLMHGSQIRQCLGYEECPDSYNKSKGVFENCTSYLYPIWCSNDQMIYKNPYCYWCITYQTLLEIKCNDMSKYFDITYDMGGTVSHVLQNIWQFSPDVTKAKIRETLSCSLGEVLDAVNHVCRPILCSYGYVLQDDKCILKNGTYTSFDLLNSGLCERYDAMVIFRGPVSSSLCLQKHIIDRLGDSEMHPKQFEQPASHDPYDYYIAFVYENVYKISNLTDIVREIFESNVCSIDRLEVIVYCSVDDIGDSLNCSGKWYVLSPSQLHHANVPDHKHIFFQEGKYVLPDQLMVFLNFDIKRGDTLEVIFFCGSEIQLPTLGCEMITFEPDEYEISLHGLVLNVGVIPNGSFLLSSHSAHVCVDSIPVRVQTTATTPYHFFYGKLDGLSFGFTCLSLVGEIATFTVYCKFKQLRNTYGVSVASLSFALFVAETSTILADKIPLGSHACVVLAVVTHYTWLSVFTWTSILAAILADTFVFRPMIMMKASSTAKHLPYQLVGWLSPLLIVSVTTIVHFFTPNGVYGGETVCWITNRMTNIFAFGVPVALVISNNMIFVVITLVALGYKRRRSNRLQNKKATTDGLKEVTVFFKV